MLIRSIVSSNLDDVSSPEIKYSFYKMKVGTEVWNWWREDKACRIRQKIAPAPLLYFEEGRVNEKWRNELDVKLAEKYRESIRKASAKHPQSCLPVQLSTDHLGKVIYCTLLCCSATVDDSTVYCPPSSAEFAK